MVESHEKPSESDAKKRVDEAWKKDVNFPFFISTLGMQALMALGEIPDPNTSEKKTDLFHARYLIDILLMLSSKTKGNLSKEEEGVMEDLLYELRMKFVAKSQGS